MSVRKFFSVESTAEALFVGDFVTGATPKSGAEFAGQIESVSDEDDPEYAVQLFGKYGPTGHVIRVNREHIDIHPVGREDVVEDSRNSTETQE